MMFKEVNVSNLYDSFSFNMHLIRSAKILFYRIKIDAYKLKVSNSVSRYGFYKVRFSYTVCPKIKLPYR